MSRTHIVITEFMDDDAVSELSSNADVVHEPGRADDQSRISSMLADAVGRIVRNGHERAGAAARSLAHQRPHDRR